MNKNSLLGHSYYDRYITLVPEEDLLDALKASWSVLKELDVIALKQLGEQVYAAGKWQIRDIFQHLADCERIMAYRALRFARRDTSLLPPFDEDHYAAEAGAARRSLEDILAELILLRHSTISMFRSFDEGALAGTGLCLGEITSAATLGYIIAGHQAHHLQVIRERYLPLLA